MYKENRHFNRIETKNAHYYMNNAKERDYKKQEYQGFIKCKLVHGMNFSIIIPDIILLDGSEKLWIQPLFFLPNLLIKDDVNINARLIVDISCNKTLTIKFTNSDYIRKFEDGSELYRCQIDGPEDLNSYSTGKFEWEADSRILLTLFHHTSYDAKNKILTTGVFKPSKWNIQGNKILKNVEYIYFTCLPEILFDQDLERIAMSSKGKMQFIIDGYEVPKISLVDHPEYYDKYILSLVVYRESTLNRKDTISLSIDAGYLSPQHILRHVSDSGYVYYEIINAFIYRLGVNPKSLWKFNTESLKGDYSNIQNMNYIVLGTATSIEGLKAPFDEENTREIFKIQNTSTNILDYWFSESNYDHFSEIDVKLNEF